ncbi:MAG TPA: protein kinase [Stackebrandtia sp.]|uniref:serine/threonine protein kinase n=1 Tax=Stackebrandtia sp. TaxID=2023065 RepID=UPI002D5DBDF8|nr:protein kinase [Stackebrandtia sp.]HZE40744.1 protein kinase [Stackebrandtia sp.]
MNPLDEPRRLGPYLLLAELGRGGMGVVYLAVGDGGKLVALKQVRPQFLDDTEFRARFRNEVTASRGVSSPYTAAVVDSDVDAELPWLASEFVYGPTLDSVIEARTIPAEPEDASLRLARGLALALSDIHRTGLIHRDVKPSNVMLDDERPRLIDFGIARAAESDGSSTITHTSWLVGSPAFMSPEHARGETLTVASDLFSLATVLYTVHTGSNPFNGPSAPQMLFNVVQNEPDLGVLSTRLRGIVEPCWAKDPADRPTAAQVVDLIGRLPEAGRVWPDAVHEEIATQRAAVARLLPDPAETAKLGPDAPWTIPSAGPAFAESASGPPADATETAKLGPKAPWAIPSAGPAFAEPASGPPSNAGLSSEAGPSFDAGPPSEAGPSSDAGPPPYGPTAAEAPTSPPPPPPMFPPTPASSSPMSPAIVATSALAVLAVLVVVIIAIVAGNHGDDSAGDGSSSSSSTSGYDDPTYDDSDDPGYETSDDPSADLDDIVDATDGTCVYGPDESYGANWDIQGCQTGNFTVADRIDDSTDLDQCTGQDMIDYSYSYSYGDTSLVLCLTMNYPDDAGHAKQNNCMIKSGDNSSATFTFSDCSSANVIVSGRTSTYNDKSFCGNDGWTTWEPQDFPELAYTVCWRWYSQ